MIPSLKLVLFLHSLLLIKAKQVRNLKIIFEFYFHPFHIQSLEAIFRMGHNLTEALYILYCCFILISYYFLIKLSKF